MAATTATMMWVADNVNTPTDGSVVSSSRLMADNVIVVPDANYEGDFGDGDDDSTTAVTTVTADARAEEIPTSGNVGASPIYDLQGRRVTSPQPGKIYICRGKKVVWTR